MRVIEEKRLAAEQSDTSPISDMQQMAQAAVHEAIVTRAQDLFDRLRARAKSCQSAGQPCPHTCIVR